MNVIRFPGSDDRKVELEKAEPESDRLYLGSFTFTCHCQTVTQFDPKNVIFKALEFFCGKCGAPHKVVNPAFMKTKK